MKKKLIIVLVVLVAVGGFAAKTILLKTPPVKMKINGTIYGLPKQFTLNLSNGQYATLTVALVLAPGQSDGATAANAGATTPDGFGTLPEEPVIRAIITNLVTGQNASVLLTQPGRARLEQEILSQIKSQTDVKTDSILFTDVAVQ